MSSPSKVFIGVPCYTGQTDAVYCSSLIGGIQYGESHGFKYKVHFEVGDADIAKCRNTIVALFMESDCTDLIMTDCDLGFDKDAFVKLMSTPVKVVAGCYPYRDGSGRYPANISVSPTGHPYIRDGMIRMDRAPTGMMRINRSAIEKFREEHPEWESNLVTKAGNKIWSIFVSGMHPDGNWYSEDFMFCTRWREMGGHIWCDPTIVFEHVGKQAVRGCFAQFLNEELAEQAKEQSGTEEPEKELVTA